MAQPLNSYVPGFDQDIFVSYAHRDDLAWATAFQTSLAEAVARRLGNDVSVWQDEHQIRAGQNWQEEIRWAIRKSATFVIISSPSYANSDWCARERRVFAESGELETTGRVFIAVKTPWERDSHKKFLNKIKDVPFFRPGDAGLSESEFVPGTRDFADGINAIANGVAFALQRLRRERIRVFVASPMDDCVDVWNEVGRELRGLGFDVQPGGRRDGAFTDELIVSEMEGAKLSLHLIGATYDAFTARQIALAADCEHQLAFWPKGQDTFLDPPQRAFIARIRKGLRPGSGDRKLPEGWSFLKEGSPRKLIEEILAILKPTVAQPAERRPGDPSSVYIVHDATTPEDAGIARELQERLGQKEPMNFLLLRPDADSSNKLRERHDTLLRLCDGVLLCHHRAPHEWFDQIAPEVLFPERRYERTPPRSRGLLRAAPSAWDSLEVPNLKVIQYTPPVRLDDLESFLAPLRP